LIVLLSMPRGRQSGFRSCSCRVCIPTKKIRQTEDYLQQHFERVGMGPRNFIRRPRPRPACGPGAYIQTLRVLAAKELLENGMSSIQAVSSKIGYEDIGFFRNLFKRHTGMTPGEYRERFSQMSFQRGELIAGRA